MTTKVCMPEVVELVEQLRPTGTGPRKLDRLLELGCETTTLESFLERALKEMPSGTAAKITELWGVKAPQQANELKVTETKAEIAKPKK